MESIRQMMSAIYLALGNAVGESALEHANRTLDDAVNSGAVDDPYARDAIMSLVRSSKMEAVH